MPAQAGDQVVAEFVFHAASAQTFFGKITAPQFAQRARNRHEGTPEYFSGLYAGKRASGVGYRASGVRYRASVKCEALASGFAEARKPKPGSPKPEARSPHLMHMPVAASLFAGRSGAAKVGNQGLEIRGQQKNSFCFRAKREKFLLEIQI